MTISRSRVSSPPRPSGRATRRRVELVPQSMLATTGAVTRSRVPGRPTQPARLRQAGGHPPADGVVAAGQEPGVVGVQALDADPGAAHTPGRPRPVVVARKGGVALGGVANVGGGELE